MLEEKNYNEAIKAWFTLDIFIIQWNWQSRCLGNDLIDINLYREPRSRT
jgi:hypothetical protein